MSSCVSPPKRDVAPIAKDVVAKDKTAPKQLLPRLSASLMKSGPRRERIKKGSSIGDALAIGDRNGRKLDKANAQITGLQNSIRAHRKFIKAVAQ